MSPTWVTFAFEVGNFLLLVALLAWLFFRPVRAAIEARRSQLESEGRAAADALAQAEREREELHKRRAEFETSQAGLREKLRAEATAEKGALIESARGQMRREREQVEEELRAARRAQARTQVRDAASAAHWIVQRVLAALGGTDLEDGLAGSACRQLEALRAEGPLGTVVIESAAPLADELRARIAAAAGIEAQALGARVEPALVAGVRVLTGRGLVDATIAGLAAQAERILLERIDAENSGDA